MSSHILSDTQRANIWELAENVMEFIDSPARTPETVGPVPTDTEHIVSV